MQVTNFDSAKAFQPRVWPLLLEREAENNLMLGIVGRLAQGAAPAAVGGAGQALFWLIEDKGEVIGAAAMTPPHRLILTRMSREAVERLAGELLGNGVELPGVVGPKETADQFADFWCRGTNFRARLSHALRIYQLDAVRPTPAAPGRMQTAGLDDADLVRGWRLAFGAEVGAPVVAEPEQVRAAVRGGGVCLWRTDQAVAVAVATGPTPSGIRIGGVYTPPEHRRKGYATSLVAALSQRQLDAGRKFCFLFTDLANPTSNSIYQKIGYRPVCDFHEYDFVNVTGGDDDRACR